VGYSQQYGFIHLYQIAHVTVWEDEITQKA